MCKSTVRSPDLSIWVFILVFYYLQLQKVENYYVDHYYSLIQDLWRQFVLL